MFSRKSESVNEVVLQNADGTFISTKGFSWKKLFGITIFKEEWDTKYVDGTDKKSSQIGLRK